MSKAGLSISSSSVCPNTASSHADHPHHPFRPSQWRQTKVPQKKRARNRGFQARSRSPAALANRRLQPLGHLTESGKFMSNWHLFSRDFG